MTAPDVALPSVARVFRSRAAVELKDRLDAVEAEAERLAGRS